MLDPRRGDRIIHPLARRDGSRLRGTLVNQSGDTMATWSFWWVRWDGGGAQDVVDVALYRCVKRAPKPKRR